MVERLLGGNMVIGLSDEPIEEVVRPPSFYWYAEEDDFDEEGNLKLTVSAGRFRHKWVPSRRSSARLFIREHEGGAGLRARNKQLRIVRISSFEIEDISEKYPQAMVEGLHGMVIKTPFTVEEIPKGRRDLVPPPFYTSGDTDIYSPIKTSQVSSIQAGILSDEDILNMSAVEVTSPIAFLDDQDNTAAIGGVHDMRMGSIDKDDPCLTCGKDRKEMDATNSCQGHFGHITLEEPIPKILYTGAEKRIGRQGYPLLFTLNHVCHTCFKIPLPDEILRPAIPLLEQQFELGRKNYRGYENIKTLLRTKFAKIWKNGVRTECPHCSAFTPKFEFTHTPYPEFFIRKANADTRYQEGATQFDFGYIRLLLQNIPDDQARLLGFDPEVSRPENMFYGVMPVAPNTLRPKKMVPGKALEIDDLSKLYQDVVYANNTLRTAKLRGYAESSIRKNIIRLYIAVSRVTDNQLQAIGSGGTTMERSYQGGEKKVSYKGIMNRLTGKEGRFRSNLQSKYVEDVGYSTIAPNGDLALDEVGVPIEMCMRASIEEKVDAKNIKRLREMIENGAEIYPGALDICEDGNTYNQDASNWTDLTKCKESGRKNYADNLEYGSIVKRHVIKGDIGLFNRAPSLHRQSILALRAVPMDQKNLSFNATICDPFNADFDGDAMKLHFVQKVEAIEEAKDRMLLTKNIIHARYGKLAIANDQDQVSGIYLLSHTNKRRKGEWNKTTGLGFTEEGIPYVSKKVALEVFSRTYSQNRKNGEKRKILSLPEDSMEAPDGTICYTGRALFSHLFTVLKCEYVTAVFGGNTPNVDEEGNITKGKEVIVIENGKLLRGTLETNAIGAKAGSIAASFIYHEGYEKGQAKLVEFIEMSTRLGLAGHRAIGFTMGVQDVKGSPESNAIVDASYSVAADKIEEIQLAYNNGTLGKFAMTQDQKVYADQDPVGFMEEQIYAVTEEFEKSTLRPVEDFQGSGNPMQISVRSKARGNASNVQQMGAAYGLVMVGGRRIRHGIEPTRVLPHYPKNSARAEHTGFIRSSYSSGMGPEEYWLTSTGGRRSTVESGMGNISKSGYLERKMIKGIESYIVDKDMRVINSRTQRVVSPIVGEDGLRPFHLRMHESNGHVIELQPFLFDFTCKHGAYLALRHDGSNRCDECSGSSDIQLFKDTIDAEFKGHRVKPSKKSMGVVESILATRQVTKPNVRKMAKKFSAYYMDSLCPPGEAIGAVAAACIGEPATQAALRTFHFAGKMSFQGSIDRLVQILESPLITGNKIKNPQSILRFHEKVDLPTAQKIANSIRTVFGSRIIRLVEYDLGSDSIIVNLDWDKVKMYNVSTDLILSRITNRLSNFQASLVTDTLEEGGSLVIYANSGGDPKKMLYIKEALESLVVNGLSTEEFGIYVKTPEEDPENMGRYWLDVRYCGNTFLNYCDELLGDYFDIELCDTTNTGWIYRKYGLEAALTSIIDQIDFQMNGSKESKGIGEYDWRYIRTIADIMGEEGIVSKLGPNGLAALANPSLLGGCSLERQWPQISHGSVMGNFDPLRGVAESIVTAKTIRVGNQISNDL
jgi:DNA-directed RNA polymerase subunit A'